jgi:glutaredoxin|tara:strand:- start:475 stop:747 length:273 start_codon:yes stop_codon:yes gene_type:complete
MKSTLIIYSQDGCPYCSELKEILTESNIPYIVRDIGKFEEEWKLVSAITENPYVPTVSVLDGQRNKRVFLAPDRDWEEITECVEKIKNLI